MKILAKETWLKTLGIFFLLFFWTTSSYAEGGGDSFSEGYYSNLDYSYLGCTVNNMPLHIRDVPVHRKDDEYKKSQGPIEQLKYDCKDSVNASFIYCWRSGKEAPRVNYGIGFDLILYPSLGYGGSEAERNYTNDAGTDNRGTGAALTYVRLRQAGIIPSFIGIDFLDLFLNWTPRVKLEIAPLGGAFYNLWIGTSLSYYSIDAQTGWDRYSNHEVRRNYKLSYVIPIRVYATYFFSDSEKNSTGITFGLQFQPNYKTDFGKQADMTIDATTYFVGLTGRMK